MNEVISIESITKDFIECNYILLDKQINIINSNVENYQSKIYSLKNIIDIKSEIESSFKSLKFENSTQLSPHKSNNLTNINKKKLSNSKIFNFLGKRKYFN